MRKSRSSICRAMFTDTSAASRTAFLDPHLESVRAAATGDRAAAALVLQIVAPHMRRVIQVVLGLRSTNTDDVLKLAMRGMLRALPAFDGSCPLTRYATPIAARVALTARRRAHAVTRVDPIPSKLEHAVVGAAEKRQTLMLELLDTLSPEQAEALGLRVVLGLSLQEVADAIEVPLNIAWGRVRQAKEAVRERIGSNAAYLEALG
jgi:RNA polymerase sigma-70 factor, ECF subfamily